MFGRLLQFLSAEWILKWWPNSGNIILFRAAWISVLVYGIAIVLRQYLAPGGSFAHEWPGPAIAHTMPWFGAIYAGIYAALYARFASQWTYLAELHNQIMAAAKQSNSTRRSRRVLTTWQAGFIEDAETLHLATKPMFAAVIRSLLSKPEVRRHYVRWTAGGEARLNSLEWRVERAFRHEEARFSKKTKTLLSRRVQETTEETCGRHSDR